MQSKSLALFTAIAAVSFVAPISGAATGYMQLAPFSGLKTTTSTTYIGSTIDGTTAYNVIGGSGTLKEITKTTGLGGSISTSQLSSSSTIEGANGGATGAFSGVLRSISDTTLQLPDTTTDAVYRINKSDGAISQYVSFNTLKGSAADFNIFASAAFSTGEAVIYDSTTATRRFRGTLNGGAYDVATFADITSLAGATYTYGGLAVGPSDNLILGDATNRRILLYNTTTPGVTTLLSTSDITGVTGQSTATFLPTAFYYSAGEGLLYFYENTGKTIMSFNPSAANPVSTLQTVLTTAQLTSGPAGANPITYFTTYNNSLAWVNVNASGQGLFAVPEPASLGLPAVLGLALLRRRR